MTHKNGTGTTNSARTKPTSSNFSTLLNLQLHVNHQNQDLNIRCTGRSLLVQTEIQLTIEIVANNSGIDSGAQLKIPNILSMSQQQFLKNFSFFTKILLKYSSIQLCSITTTVDLSMGKITLVQLLIPSFF